MTTLRYLKPVQTRARLLHPGIRIRIPIRIRFGIRFVRGAARWLPQFVNANLLGAGQRLWGWGRGVGRWRAAILCVRVGVDLMGVACASVVSSMPAASFAAQRKQFQFLPEQIEQHKERERERAMQRARG